MMLSLDTESDNDSESFNLYVSRGAVHAPSFDARALVRLKSPGSLRYKNFMDDRTHSEMPQERLGGVIIGTPRGRLHLPPAGQRAEGRLTQTSARANPIFRSNEKQTKTERNNE